MRFLYIIICLFFGFLGLHRFFAKHFKMGALYLGFLFGGFVLELTTIPGSDDLIFGIADTCKISLLLIWSIDLFSIIFLGRFPLLRKNDSQSAEASNFGTAKMEYDDGSVYEGTYSDGLQHGQGNYKLPNGYEYTGEWVKGEIKGHGVAKFPNGAVYEGAFVAGAPQGQGRITYEDGATYEGSFTNGKIDGFGVSRYVDGSVYKGEFRTEKRHGKGILTYIDGSIFDCEWKSDVADGNAKITYADGSTYSGKVSNGVRDGLGRFKNADGKILEGIWSNGELATPSKSKFKIKEVELSWSGAVLGITAARLSSENLKDLRDKARSSGEDFLKNHLQTSDKVGRTRFPYAVGFNLEELQLSVTQTGDVVDLGLGIENEITKLTEIEDDQKIIEFIGVTNGFSKLKSSFEIPENESFDASKLELKILSVNLYGYVGLKSKILTGVEYMGQLHNFDLEIQDEALERYLLVYDEDCDVILDEKAGEFDRAALFDFE